MGQARIGSSMHNRFQAPWGLGTAATGNESSAGDPVGRPSYGPLASANLADPDIKPAKETGPLGKFKWVAALSFS